MSEIWMLGDKDIIYKFLIIGKGDIPGKFPFVILSLPCWWWIDDECDLSHVDIKDREDMK